MIDDNTKKVVNELFSVIRAINPAFKQAWPTEAEYRATKRQWMLAFQGAGIDSIEQLKKGVSTLRLTKSPFVPSPGQFIDMCKMSPHDIGAPDVDAAYAEACRISHPCFTEKEFSHEAVRLTALSIGLYSLYSLPEHKTRKAFESEYLIMCDLIGSGKDKIQLEQTKERKFTEVEQHWINCVEFFKLNNWSLEECSHFPTQELLDRAIELHKQWGKQGGEHVKR